MWTELLGRIDKCELDVFLGPWRKAMIEDVGHFQALYYTPILDDLAQATDDEESWNYWNTSGPAGVRAVRKYRESQR